MILGDSSQWGSWTYLYLSWFTERNSVLTLSLRGNMNYCLECKIEIKKRAKRCIPCGNKQNGVRYQARAREERIKVCEYCQLKYEPHSSLQRTCSNICKEKQKNAASALIWLKTTKPKPSANGIKISPPKQEEL